MAISVADPFSQAISRTGDILFKPFDFIKWLAIALCAFLAYLVEQGHNFQGWFQGVSPRMPGPQPPPRAPQHDPLQWILDNFAFAMVIGLASVVVGVAITALFQWLQARGKLMLIDNLAYNRGEIVAPWKVYRKVANSLFLFNMLLILFGLAIMLCIAALCVAIAWPDIRAAEFGAPAITALTIAGLLFVLLSIAWGLVSFAIEHFVVPAMYLRMETVLPAWGIAWREIITAHTGSVVLFLLMRILLYVVLAVITSFATCVTCCIAAVPYVGTVILLPLFVFSRGYTLCFLQQIGPEWRIFQYDRDTICQHCGYDLTGLPEIGRCPECGTDFDRRPHPPNSTEQA